MIFYFLDYLLVAHGEGVKGTRKNSDFFVLFELDFTYEEAIVTYESVYMVK